MERKSNYFSGIEATDYVNSKPESVKKDEEKKYVKKASLDFLASKYRRSLLSEKIKKIINLPDDIEFENLIKDQPIIVVITIVLLVLLIFIWLSTRVAHARYDNKDPMLLLEANPNIHNQNVEVPLVHHID